MIWFFYSIHCLLPANQRKLNHFVKLLSYVWLSGCKKISKPFSASRLIRTDGRNFSTSVRIFPKIWQPFRSYSRNLRTDGLNFPISIRIFPEIWHSFWIVFPEFTDGWSRFSHFSTYFAENLTALPLIFPEFTAGWPQFPQFSTYFAENPAYHLPLITFFACQHPDIEILLLCSLMMAVTHRIFLAQYNV